MDEAGRRERLEQLYARIQADPRSHGGRMGTALVPGAGSLAGGVPVFVGEAPGREEEIRREPFVGQAGRNLDALLESIHWSRERVFVTNLVKFRPVDGSGANRTPTRAEGRYALAFLLEELAILEPSLVVCLGLTAARILLEDMDLKMGHANGARFFRHGHAITVTYHPSPFNYRVPSKRAALRDAFHRLKRLSL